MGNKYLVVQLNKAQYHLNSTFADFRIRLNINNENERLYVLFSYIYIYMKLYISNILYINIYIYR